MAYPVLVNDVYDGGNFTGIFSFGDIHHAADLNKLLERLQQQREIVSTYLWSHIKCDRYLVMSTI